MTYLHTDKRDTKWKTFETDLDKLMNERFKTFFENKNAVLPLLDGFHYVPQDGAATQKGANEISDLDSLIKQAQDRACNVYHVAPSLLRGEVTNIDEAIRSTLSFGVKPPLRLIETEINRKAYGKDVLNGWKMMVDTTHIRLVDVFDAAAQADKLVQDALYNVNELREKFEDDPIPERWASEYNRTKNMEKVQPQAAAPKGGEK